MTEEYPEVKFAEIRGKTFAIRRFTDADDEKLAEVANSPVKYRRLAILLACEDPKFKDEAEVAALDREISLGLYVSIEEFNRLNTDFLQRLKNLRSQVLPLLEMNEQSVTLRGRLPSTNSSSVTASVPTK